MPGAMIAATTGMTGTTTTVATAAAAITKQFRAAGL
jgi:hypothetical protein